MQGIVCRSTNRSLVLALSYVSAFFATRLYVNCAARKKHLRQGCQGAKRNKNTPHVFLPVTNTIIKASLGGFRLLPISEVRPTDN
jgi:hypothetical protein